MMLKKALKIKGVEGRTALVEFVVNKRVKYLEYLKELHTEEGTLWMNTVHLNLHEIGKYFNIPNACLPASGDAVSRDELLHLPAEKPVGASANEGIATPSGNGGRSAGPNATGDDFITVSIAHAPAAIQQRSSSAVEWARCFLPCYAALAISLSDILLLPIGGEDFLECFAGLLLELEAAYALGAARKALTQRSLRQFRQHVSPALKALLQTSADAEVGDAPLSSSPASTSPDLDAHIKYLFLNHRHIEYTVACPSYDALIPALCSVLMFAYRKLCDYELMKSEKSVSRILSIDKRLKRIFFSRVSHEIDKIAKHKLLREAYVLSPDALFSDLVGVAGRGSAVSRVVTESGANFVADLLNEQQRYGASSLSVAAKRGSDSSDDDEDDGVSWECPGEVR
ncbi:hypothetical protein JKF63_07553 [Porcisia hertigi]|uniref:Uncharacterized protein n=1 Tax=Porcisia hertigi TaxID=2761500 RepID=A0A836LM85_9TRYP|nr:hypothetical protein JKF63_07553 [Porcisia hertigi]